MTYLLLFLTAFAAATVLPLSSELAVVAALNTQATPWLIWAAVSLGNILGSVVNWALGLFFERFKNKSWFPFKTNQLNRAQNLFNRYGQWSLLFAWVPIIGDALTLIAGVMRMRLWLFLTLVSIGKSLRYIIVIWAVLQAQNNS